jgi:hypothetical protein
LLDVGVVSGAGDTKVSAQGATKVIASGDDLWVICPYQVACGADDAKMRLALFRTVISN